MTKAHRHTQDLRRTEQKLNAEIQQKDARIKTQLEENSNSQKRLKDAEDRVADTESHYNDVMATSQATANEAKSKIEKLTKHR